MTDAQAVDAHRPNHLVHEKSPYLLQHAYNPVDWYPWGDAAFEKARKEDKPIFLSIGYSTCHWCHVMERESFSAPKLAAILNRNFVAIKVDREERPDVDQIYMTAVQAMTGQGGWPLNVFLTSDLKPFYGGTYFPPESRWGRPGFPEILERVAELWRTDRQKLVSSGDELSRAIAQYAVGEESPGSSKAESRPKAGASALDRGFESYRKTFDPRHGGFGGAPKFPMPVNHNFLLRYFARTGRNQALEMSAFTLREMAKGGIHDHLGGGFHRYSTDDHWHVPHFEKMLYDNAQIAVNFLEAYQLTQDPEFARVALTTLDYVLRDMTDPRGGFYSAEDADSLPPELAGKVQDHGHEHRSEGAFYLWTHREILDLLGHELGEMFCYRFGVEEAGNAKEDPQGEFRGKNILYSAHTISETAKKFDKTEAEIQKALEEAAHKLFLAREKRPRPHRDDKILAAWNGLMISALAKAGTILDKRRYTEAAEKAARFIRKEMYDSGRKRLYRRWRQGERKVPAMADDYAFLVRGLLDLYEADFDPAWLQWAEELTEEQNRLFYDVAHGGFFMTSRGDDDRLLARVKSDSDNVEPAAGSVAALNLLRLAQFTDRKDFMDVAEKTLSASAESLEKRPLAFPQMLVALDYDLSKPRQIVIAGDLHAPDAQALLQEVRKRFIPNKIILLVDGGEGQKILARRLPFLSGMMRIGGKASAYVCVGYACQRPTNDLKILQRQLDEAASRNEKLK